MQRTEYPANRSAFPLVRLRRCRNGKLSPAESGRVPAVSGLLDAGFMGL